ncbi:secreted protein, putative, partial [Ixodes scapularis]
PLGRPQVTMKIQAFLIIAVVTALLPVVNCAPAENATEEEDRSCTKRDKDAENPSTPVPGCNYYCEPDKGSNNYVEKYYKDGTPCQYNTELTSKCKDKTCYHPEDPVYKKDKENKNPENKEEKQKEEEKTKEDKNEDGQKEDETTKEDKNEEEQTEETIKEDKNEEGQKEEEQNEGGPKEE